MTGPAHQKVNTGHLKRNAYLYVRQSTLRQVFENTESTKRQYGLRQSAVALGWPVERIIVIDSDLGQSGASAVDRRGIPEAGHRSQSGESRYCAWPRSIAAGAQLNRLAQAAGDLRADRHAHSRRRRRV
jgi:DNA invertase Pin-like site-specific DNA recombinase